MGAEEAGATADEGRRRRRDGPGRRRRLTARLRSPNGITPRGHGALRITVLGSRRWACRCPVQLARKRAGFSFWPQCSSRPCSPSSRRLTAADGDPPDTITVCHSTGGSKYVPDKALENDFYGTPPKVTASTQPTSSPRSSSITRDPATRAASRAETRTCGETLLANDCELPSLPKDRKTDDDQARRSSATRSR